MQDTSYELLTIFHDGGFMMVPLVLCSLVALGVIIAKGWTLFVAHRDSKKLLKEIQELGELGQIDEAIKVARETRGPVAAILLTGLRRVKDGGGTQDV
ncbi:MAG: hypothetical protein JJE01_08395, partial [Gemmatimonadetes bacterium]|nr:hypothetical protein [Gemmatimonadota bacterium]